MLQDFKEQSRELGVNRDTVDDDADEEDSPKDAVIELKKKANASAKQRKKKATGVDPDELQETTLQDFKEQSRELGVNRDTVDDDADEEGSPKDAVIELIKKANASSK